MEDFKFEKLAMILYLNMINFLSNKDKKTAERIILSELFQGQTLLEQHKKNNQIT
jgi:stress-induced morphogen